MTVGIEIYNPNGRGVLLDGDEGFANPIAKGYGKITTSRSVFKGDPLLSYVYCNLVIPLTGYDSTIHALSYSVLVEDAETLPIDHVYFNLSNKGAFSLVVANGTLTLTYRNPSSGYEMQGTSAFPYLVRFTVLYEYIEK